MAEKTEMDEMKNNPYRNAPPPPPYDGQTHVVVVSPPPQEDVPFKWLYLLVLIFNLVETVAYGIVALVCLFSLDILISVIKTSFSQAKEIAAQDLSPEPEITGQVVAVIRLIFVVALAVEILIQYIGWKGYREHHAGYAFTFGCCHGFRVFLRFTFLCVMGFYVVSFLLMLVRLAYTGISITFGYQVYRQQSRSQIV